TMRGCMARPPGRERTNYHAQGNRRRRRPGSRGRDRPAPPHGGSDCHPWALLFAEELVPEPRKIACPSHLRRFHETAEAHYTARVPTWLGGPSAVNPRNDGRISGRLVERPERRRGSLPWSGAECRAPGGHGIQPCAGRRAATEVRMALARR